MCQCLEDSWHIVGPSTGTQQVPVLQTQFVKSYPAILISFRLTVYMLTCFSTMKQHCLCKYTDEMLLEGCIPKAGRVSFLRSLSPPRCGEKVNCEKMYCGLPSRSDYKTEAYRFHIQYSEQFYPRVHQTFIQCTFKKQLLSECQIGACSYTQKKKSSPGIKEGGKKAQRLERGRFKHYRWYVWIKTVFICN